MNFNKSILSTSKLPPSNSNIPIFQKRIYSRAISVEQLISQQTKQNQSKEHYHQIEKSLFQNMKQDQSNSIVKDQLKLRSLSLTHRQKQSQTNLHKQINQQKIMNLHNNIEISLSQQGMQLLKIQQKRQNFNKALNSIVHQKIQSNPLNFQSNANINNSQVCSQNEQGDRDKINQKKSFKQFDFESKIPEGPLLSFRQFAKLQGLKLPQYLE